MNDIVIHHRPNFVADVALDSPTPATLTAQDVDAQVLLPGRVSCSLWWTSAPPCANEKLGVIGHFRATASAKAADVMTVLEAASGVLRGAGCTRAAGPMDGNTWRSYRFVTWRGDEPRFLLEPDQPDTWPAWWQSAGFAAWEHYNSAVVEQLDASDPRLASVRERLDRIGVTIRELDPGSFAAELARIYAVSIQAFRENVLYTPLAEAPFHAMYQPALPLMRPGLCFLAECAGAPVGFVFALPDHERARRGAPVDTVVIKTLAIIPRRDLSGLGKLLLERCQQSAHRLGFRRAIHALMHQANRSRNLGIGAQEIRRYTLFSR
ncbi:MAG: GNAT family N-acetyltransferase, partial [Planctomycetota bacterium]